MKDKSTDRHRMLNNVIGGGFVIAVSVIALLTLYGLAVGNIHP